MAVVNISASESITFSESATPTAVGTLAGATTIAFSTSAFAQASQFGGTYNAVSYFATGGTVTITLYHPKTAEVISLSDNTCTEIPGTGVYLWHSELLTAQPLTFQEYDFKMTNGTLLEGGTIEIAAPFTTSVLNPVLHR